LPAHTINTKGPSNSSITVHNNNSTTSKMLFASIMALMGLALTSQAAPTSNANNNVLAARDGPVTIAFYEHDSACNEPNPEIYSLQANACYDIHIAKGLKVLSWDSAVRFDSGKYQHLYIVERLWGVECGGRWFADVWNSACLQEWRLH
jgi:hypothetical protein